MAEDAGAAREQAREILRGGEYSETDLPRPLEDPLEWLDARLDDVGGWFDDLFSDVDAGVPGGEWVVWVVLAAAVALVAAAVARSAIGRRRVDGFGRRRSADGGEAADPAALERAADAAEGAGDFERAVRLRFEAGALRLRLETATTGVMAEQLSSPAFDALGAEHDAIAYGGRTAGADEASAAREGWAAVLEESRR